MNRVGRYDNPYEVTEWHRPLPPGSQCEPVNLVTDDRAISHGWLYSKGGEDTVVCAMHPRANFSRHYIVPGLVEAGFAVFCQNSRWLNNDATMVHERVLLDVASGVRHVRERIFPGDTEQIASSLASPDLTRKSLPGDPYGFPAQQGRDGAVEEVVSWLKSR